MEEAFYTTRRRSIDILFEIIRGVKDRYSRELLEFSEIWISNSIGGLCAGDFRYAKESLSRHSILFGTIVRLYFWLGVIEQLLICTVERFIYRRSFSSGWDTCQEVFVGILRKDNGSKRFFEYFDLRPNREFIFIKIGGPLRAAHSWKMALWSRYAKIVTPYYWRDFPKIIFQVIKPQSLLLMFSHTLRPEVKDRSLFDKSRMFGRHLVKGLLSAEWTRRQKGRGVVVFPILRPDLAMFDSALRSSNIKTAHWLHGTVEHAFKFHGFSDLAVALNPKDKEVCEKFGHYKRVSMLPEVKRREPHVVSSGRSAVILTNLLHPGHKLPDSQLNASLHKLFEVVRDALPGSILWRPHPREKQSPLFGELVEHALGQDIGIDDSPSLALCIRRHDIAICTASGVIGDVVAEGIVPLVWSDIWYEKTGLWDNFPEKLLFQSKAEFLSAAESMRSVEGAALYEELWTRFHCGGATIPASGYFLSQFADGDEKNI